MHQQNREVSLCRWRIALARVPPGYGTTEVSGEMSDASRCHVEREAHQPPGGPACLDTHAAHR
ncbi:hypothetical protein AB0D11_46660 [Streptomyces monashensis]|uniref:hypothetical protein n=1 Tax=Streptomyces monashensis TaxID=1678012 RepID=UPI0033E34DFA